MPQTPNIFEWLRRSRVGSARWFTLGSLTLVVLLTLYCEVWSVMQGIGAPALHVSASWAIKVSFGWIWVGAALGLWGRRAFASSAAIAHPYVWVVVMIATMTIVVLSCETGLTLLRSGAADFADIWHARGPLTVTTSAIVIAMFIARQRATPSAAPIEDAVTVSRTIEVMTGTSRVTINVSDIEYLRADGNYVRVLHRSGRSYLVRSTLSAAEQSLDAASFVRVHRSTIVNRQAIKHRKAGGLIVLQSGAIVRVGRSFSRLLKANGAGARQDGARPQD